MPRDSKRKVPLEVVIWVPFVLLSIQLLTMMSNPVFYIWRNHHVATGLWRMAISCAIFIFGCCSSDEKIIDLESQSRQPPYWTSD
ncbi:unnamed protein product [Allacma fusca]|uniref:Uncharacterized protein n=1 Tax=Allacma fusca TaxID=39272 RepID=A0A8J2JDX3_9HEXA|nr:unnamed protein product [Allacma fusca]